MVRSDLPENIRIYMLFIIFQNQWLLLTRAFLNFIDRVDKNKNGSSLRVDRNQKYDSLKI